MTGEEIKSCIEKIEVFDRAANNRFEALHATWERQNQICESVMLRENEPGFDHKLAKQLYAKNKEWQIEVALCLRHDTTRRTQVTTHTVRFSSPNNDELIYRLRYGELGPAIAFNFDEEEAVVYVNENYVNGLVLEIKLIAATLGMAAELVCRASDIRNHLIDDRSVVIIWSSFSDYKTDEYCKRLEEAYADAVAASNDNSNPTENQ